MNARVACVAMLPCVVASLAIAVPAAAAPDDGTCTINEAKVEVFAGPNGTNQGRFQRLNVGEVYRLGALSIRAAGRSGSDWILDLKAPGFTASNQPFEDDKPVSYRICGQDVSVTVSYQPRFSGTALVVSIF